MKNKSDLLYMRARVAQATDFTYKCITSLYVRIQPKVYIKNCSILILQNQLQ